jgi:hypothetical protein
MHDDSLGRPRLMLNSGMIVASGALASGWKQPVIVTGLGFESRLSPLLCSFCNLGRIRGDVGCLGIMVCRGSEVWWCSSRFFGEGRLQARFRRGQPHNNPKSSVVSLQMLRASSILAGGSLLQ